MSYRDKFDPLTNSEEYEFGYDIIRWAMEHFTEPDLQFLRNAMSKATCFLHDELEDLEDVTKDLGLDKWLEYEEERRADEEEWEREQQEEEEALAAQADESEND